MVEVFDLVDERNKLIGKTATRKECHTNPNLIHRDIHILVVNSNDQILLKKRSPNKDLYPNCWETSASGHVDSGETYEQSAYRELKEELDIKEKDVTLQAIADFYNFSETESQISRLYVCYYDKGIRLNHESVKAKLFKTNDIIEILEKNIPLKLTPGSFLALAKYIIYLEGG